MGVKYGWKMILGLNVVTAILSATELFSIFTRPVKEPVSESSDDGDEPMTFEGMHRDWLDDREPPSDIECPSSSDDNDANENNPTDHVNIEDIRYIYVDVLGCFYPEILRCCSGSNPDEPLNLYPLIHMIEGMFPTGPTWMVIDGMACDTQMHIRNTHPNTHIIGIDLGAECMFAAVAYNPDDPAHLQTLAVRTKSITEPERLFRSWLQLTKPERLVGIERQCTKSADDGWPAFMKAFVIAYDELHCHYGGKCYMKRSWDAAKAKQGEMDRALEGLVRMVGETMGNKLPDKKKVIVAIGLGEFETTNSRHIGFTRVHVVEGTLRGKQ
ncbi:hypothetical protein SeMB42_g07185 [Synchytrium endobioticum]|uniref:Uncharacterized protein n=1 Tax=Synchytrium endobioticum TaxID=286115 RepID=A0A507C7V1_9FUNG|nr:hypothetical protein SeMB42_g07185 [Synchytrium endobioticum]